VTTWNIPVGSSDGPGGVMRIAKHSHCLRRDEIHLCAPKPMPELTNGRQSWWITLSSYWVCSTQVIYNSEINYLSNNLT